MASLSINETTTFRWSFEEDVERYAAAGIPAVGVWRHKLSDFGEAKGAELIATKGLQVSHLYWAGGFTGSEGRSYKAAVDDAREAIRHAADLGTRCLVIFSGGRGGHTFNHARRLVREALKELLPVAEEFGVDLALEPMHPNCAEEFTFLTVPEDVLDLIEEIGSPRVKMVFDAYHLGFDPDVTYRLAEWVPHIALVQLGDAKREPGREQNRCPLGQGTLPLAEIVTNLKGNGYDGFYDVELLGEDVELFAYSELLENALSFYKAHVDNT